MRFLRLLLVMNDLYSRPHVHYRSSLRPEATFPAAAPWLLDWAKPIRLSRSWPWLWEMAQDYIKGKWTLARKCWLNPTSTSLWQANTTKKEDYRMWLEDLKITNLSGIFLWPTSRGYPASPGAFSRPVANYKQHPPIFRGALQLLLYEIFPEIHGLGCADPRIQFFGPLDHGGWGI